MSTLRGVFKLFLCSVLLWVCQGIQGAEAGIMVFTDRAAFQANTTGNVIEDFNSITTDTGFVSADLTVGSLTLSSDGGASIFGPQALVDVSPYVNAASGIDGTAMINSRGLDAGQSITISLPGNFSAFGFDFENYDLNLEGLEVVIGSTTVASIPATRSGFIGIVDNMGGLFSQVKLVSVSTETDANSGGTFNAIDNVEWGMPASAAVVPEASSLIVWVVGSAGLCGFCLRRKRREATPNSMANTDCNLV